MVAVIYFVIQNEINSIVLLLIDFDFRFICKFVEWLT